MKIQTILFDLDNTLVRCMLYYEFIRKNMYAVLSAESGLTVVEISELFDEVESVRVKKSDGFSKLAFLDSVNAVRVSIYSKLKKSNETDAERFYSSNISFKLLHLASSVYEAPYSMYDEVHEVLTVLKNLGYSMLVVTKGDFYGQSRKASLLPSVFDGLFVLPCKNKNTWNGVIESLQLDRHRTLVVGDSIHDDINPAILNQLHAVRIDRGNTTWVGDPLTEASREVQVIRNLKELLDILEEKT